MSRQHRNDKSPTATLCDPTTPTYSQMRGTPEGGGSPGNPWDLMLKADHHKVRRLPRFDWVSLVVWLAVAAVAIGLVCLLK